MIDKSAKIYGEYDSLCRDRNSNYVFELLCTVFQMANIDLTSLRKLHQEERECIPSQEQNTTECGVFLLGLMCAFVNGLSFNFDLKDVSFLCPSFAKILMNGRPPFNSQAANASICDQEVRPVATGSQVPEAVSLPVHPANSNQVLSGSTIEQEHVGTLQDDDKMEDDPFEFPPPLSTRPSSVG